MRTAMDGENKSPKSLFQFLLDRFRSLEASHQKLKEQFEVVLQERNGNTSPNEEKDVASDSDDVTSFPGWGDIPGRYFLLGSPYRNVLDYMGHAVNVTRIGSWEIIYWNRAAEKLFGYKDYEVLGQRVIELLFDEEHHHSALAIMQRLTTGKSWAGQLPLKKRSGQSMMALVTKTPLYENGEIAGIVSVSSDASVFNNTNSSVRSNRDNACEQSRFGKINLKKIHWHPRPQIAAVPQLASSVSNLASKVLLRKRGDVSCEEAEVKSHDVKADRPPRVPAIKFLQKLHIGSMSNLEKVVDENIQQNSSEDNSMRREAANVTCSPRDSTKNTSHICNLDASNPSMFAAIGISNVAERKHIDTHSSESGVFLGACQGCFDVHTPAGQLPRSSIQSDGSKSLVNLPNMKSPNSEDASPGQSSVHKISSSGECLGRVPGRFSSKGESDSQVNVNSEIRWEDLQLREEIGQGSFAVVYRGIWNGSDVAVKVYYSGSQYSEETLLDSKKEIDIMRRLRHPNVLLYMGAVFSEERIAMVTEYMTRGSLFKTLHKSNQPLDIRRRLRMALDVARGMNYLHRRYPPIVHRDLKSSNLLVDKSWTVKVGDFGLSKLKFATFLTAKSGRGTPQWMAPEVLRNELSTEKSDVFSFGVILWELMTESIPWSDLNALQVVGVVGFMDRRLDLPETIDPQISSIISECWRRNPEDRPSFECIIHRMTHLVHAGAMPTARTPSTPRDVHRFSHDD